MLYGVGVCYVCMCGQTLSQVTETNDTSLLGSFETTSCALAINNDSVYRAADGRLEVCNVSGAPLCGNGSAVVGWPR